MLRVDRSRKVKTIKYANDLAIVAKSEVHLQKILEKVSEVSEE